MKKLFLIHNKCDVYLFQLSDMFRVNPLLIFCVLMLVADCEIDVILVRVKSLPPSLGHFGSVNFSSGQRFLTVLFISATLCLSLIHSG